MYEKYATNIILDDERLNASASRSGTNKGYLLFPFLFNIVLRGREWNLAQKGKKKEIQIGKRQNVLFVD